MLVIHFDFSFHHSQFPLYDTHFGSTHSCSFAPLFFYLAVSCFTYVFGKGWKYEKVGTLNVRYGNWFLKTWIRLFFLSEHFSRRSRLIANYLSDPVLLVIYLRFTSISVSDFWNCNISTFSLPRLPLKAAYKLWWDYLGSWFNKQSMALGS